MSKYELNHAVTLFTQQTTIINNLWSIYVVATFAAAGYGASLSSMSESTAVAVTIGFWAFALGHLRLLTQALKINSILREALLRYISSSEFEKEDTFKSSIQCLADTANPLYISVAIHLAIDICVTVALWSRV